MPRSKSATKPKATKPKATKPKATKTYKRKKLSVEELHPFSMFPFRLEFKDGEEIRVCHFQCEEHRNKHIKRYGMRKNQFCIDDFTTT